MFRKYRFIIVIIFFFALSFKKKSFYYLNILNRGKQINLRMSDSGNINLNVFKINCADERKADILIKASLTYSNWRTFIWLSSN